MSHSTSLPLSVLLERIGQELAGEAEKVRELHALVEGGQGTQATMVTAQTIDTSSQNLGELSALLARVAALAGGATVDATCFETMTLSSLRGRLLGEAEAEAEAGEVDFF